jgi:Na+-translocating ferredoxin:NAD+ oxidoreductase RnfA subunit
VNLIEDMAWISLGHHYLRTLVFLLMIGSASVVRMVTELGNLINDNR